MGHRALRILGEIRDAAGPRRTRGLDDLWIEQFLDLDPRLAQAIEEARVAVPALARDVSGGFGQDEADLIRVLQQDYVPFYDEATINPYVPVAARGPWVVTSHGAVVHDSGGYGMLGLGHAPEPVLRTLAPPVPMANVMTASVSQLRFASRLKREIGHTRGCCPYARFVCLNSGSEAITVAMRISDILAHRVTQPGGRYAGRRSVVLALRQGFHGRTDRPARVSHSTLALYRQHLASFREEALIIVDANDIDGLHAAFARATDAGQFIELAIVEPVMGEGRPGRAMGRGFYDAVRQLTREHGSLFLVDSIQAGLRAHGVLSVVDYPGFEDAEPPDMEAYSKALNAGQYPLSTLALSDEAAALYVRGLYGNTMTTNPRALAVGAAVLDQITPELRRNIRERGAELVAALRTLQDEFPQAILAVEGTGLLVAAELEPVRFPVVGADGVEMRARQRGIGLIHGGRNALRLTPHFGLTSAEIAMMIANLRDVLGGMAHHEAPAGAGLVAEETAEQ